MGNAPDNNRSKDREIAHLELSEVKREAEDVLSALGEVALDSFLYDGPAKDIPIIGTVVKLLRGGKRVRDWIFSNKLAEFALNAPHIDTKKKKKFRDKLKADPIFAKSTMTHLVVILDRLDELEKSALLARIFGAYIEGTIERQQFRRLAAAIERTLIADLLALRDFVQNQIPLTYEHYYGLEGAGLAFTYHSILRPIESDEMQGKVGGTNFILSPYATLLVKVAF